MEPGETAAVKSKANVANTRRRIEGEWRMRGFFWGMIVVWVSSEVETLVNRFGGQRQ